MRWAAELKQPGALRADIVAGVTVAMVLIPQSMAYAQLAGLPVACGLYAAFLPVIVAALFGSSDHLSTGPVAVVSLMTASALTFASSDPGRYGACAALLAMFVGLLCLSAGLLKLSLLADLLSHAVVVGFTSAAALIIATSQLGALLGIKAAQTVFHYHSVLDVLARAPTEAHGWTVAMSAIALALMAGLRKAAPRAPAVMVAVVLTGLLAWAAGFEDAGGRVVGEVPRGLPAASLSFAAALPDARALLPGALAIAMMGFIEALSISRALATRTRQRLDPNRELVGQGLANVAASLFGAYPVSGSFSRSAVNFDAGARTGFSSVAAGLAVGITLMGLTPLLRHVPQATLATVIVAAVIPLVKVEPIVRAWRVNRHDGAAAVATFALTLALAPRVEWAILSGVGISVLLFKVRSMRPRFAELSMHADGSLRDAKLHNLRTSDLVSVLRFDGSLYFGSAGYFQGKLLAHAAAKPRLRYVILDLEGVNEVDVTGGETLEGLVADLRAGGVQTLFARPKRQVMDVFQITGLVDRVGKEHFFRRTVGAIAHVLGELGPELARDCPLRPPPDIASEMWTD
jgi:SulP family sulfate permease